MGLKVALVVLAFVPLSWAIVWLIASRPPLHLPDWLAPRMLRWCRVMAADRFATAQRRYASLLNDHQKLVDVMNEATRVPYGDGRIAMADSTATRAERLWAVESNIKEAAHECRIAREELAALYGTRWTSGFGNWFIDNNGLGLSRKCEGIDVFP